MEKKQREHTEAVTQLQRDLTDLSVVYYSRCCRGNKYYKSANACSYCDSNLIAVYFFQEYESLLRETGEDFLLKLSEHDKQVKRLMQKTDHGGDLEAFDFQVIS